MNTKLTDISIILTATVNVDERIYKNSHKTTNMREKEYIDACKYYESFPFVKHIYLVENSGWKFKSTLPEKVQLISLDSKAFTSDIYSHITNIKTLGDLECIQTGLNTITDLDDFVIKLTGRLKIQNFEKLVNVLNYDKINVAQYIKSHKWVSSWFIAGKCSTMKNIFDGMYKPLLDKHFADALEWIETPQNITVECLEKTLYKVLKIEDLNIIKGDYKVEEKPCSECVFHFPDYRFDGYIEKFTVPREPKRTNKSGLFLGNNVSLSVQDMLNPLNINKIQKPQLKTHTRGNKTTTNQKVIEFLKKASELKPEDLPKYDGKTIPKIIHFCYINYKQIPDTHDSLFLAWMKYLPDYTFINWTPDKIKEISFTKHALLNKKWAFFADYARVYAVSMYGGFYLDCDVMVYKSFNELLDLPYVFDAERHPVDNKLKRTLECGSFGAQPNNKLLNTVRTYYENTKEVIYNGSLVAPTLWNQIANDNNITINYDSTNKYKDKTENLFDEDLNINIYKNKVLSDPNIIYALDSTYLSKPNMDIRSNYHSTRYTDKHGVFPWAFTSHQFYTEWSFDKPSQDM